MPDLTTLALTKSWLAIAEDDTSPDTILSGLITSTSSDFLREIERVDLLQATYTETRIGDGDDRIVLRHWPLTAVALLTVAGSLVVAQADGADGYYFDADLDPERRWSLRLQGSKFADGAKVSIEYTAGYAAVPGDIAQAIAEWVAARYRGRPSQGLTSQRDAGGQHVTYDKAEPMPPTVTGVANRYRRTWPSLDRRTDDREYRVTRINRTLTVTEKA